MHRRTGQPPTLQPGIVSRPNSGPGGGDPGAGGGPERQFIVSFKTFESLKLLYCYPGACLCTSTRRNVDNNYFCLPNPQVIRLSRGAFGKIDFFSRFDPRRPTRKPLFDQKYTNSPEHCHEIASLGLSSGLGGDAPSGHPSGVAHRGSARPRISTETPPATSAGGRSVPKGNYDAACFLSPPDKFC